MGKLAWEIENRNRQEEGTHIRVAFPKEKESILVDTQEAAEFEGPGLLWRKEEVRLVIWRGGRGQIKLFLWSVYALAKELGKWGQRGKEGSALAAVFVTDGR